MPDTLPNTPLTDDEELSAIREKWTKHPKLSRWFDLYFDSTNAATFNKQTESAIVAYELNPDDPDDRKTAWEMGSRNARKVKVWAQKYYEQLGWTKEKVLDLIAVKAVSTNNARYVLMLAELTDTYEEKPKVAITNNTQINNNVQISAQEEADLDREFAEFINDKYSKPTPLAPDNTSSHPG